MRQKLVTCTLIAILFLARLSVFATEGMWLPQLLGRLNEKEMKGMGMKISAADIYNVNKGSLKDAIVSFGGFCTGEIISSKGLLLTNHHCGFDAIQKHSSLQNNYLERGFWARSMQEELPNPGLAVTFIVRIEDVTKQALQGVAEGLTEIQRQTAIDRNLAAIQENAKKESWQGTLVKPFFEGNQYFLFVTETYKDVRLVGAPPSSIGKFGADTDNWVWPRHTGDFSMFRVYAGRDGRPADYSKDNVPLKPKHFLPISLDGVAENDFTMVFGFPGRTYEYIPSESMKLIVEGQDPARVSMRDAALKVIDGFMRQDEQIKIQYATKQASIANSWKKWIGEMQGVRKTNGIQRKLDYEARFRQLVNNNAEYRGTYSGLLDSLNGLYKKQAPYAIARDYYAELVRNVEMLSFANSAISMLQETRLKGEEQYETLRQTYLNNIEAKYKNYSNDVDREVAAALLDLYFKEVPSNKIGGEAWQIWMETNKDGKKAAEKMYSRSAFVSYDKLAAFLNRPFKTVSADVWKDPATRLMIGLRNGYIDFVIKPYDELQPDITRLQRRYMAAQMEVMKDKRFYPDANSTLRITYGKVNGYTPRDAVQYDFITTLDGVMEKYKPGDYEFDVPEKLRELYAKKDYGQYGANGKMPICFIASNHTTGGNSGSPALDAYGNLVGLNFDRTWEGTMSDINYDPAICRNIMTDIRYVLFLVDKFAGAKNLIEEMKLVHPKKKRTRAPLRKAS